MKELEGIQGMLNDDPKIITRRVHVSKVTLLVSDLSGAGIDSAAALRKHWAERDNKFLFKCLKKWIKPEYQQDAKNIWIRAVKENVKQWSERKRSL